MKALVYKSTGSWYNVVDEAGKPWKARIKGIFRTEDLSSTNPIAVGDWVTLEADAEEDGIAAITAIDDRRNYITRQSPHNKNLHHIIAANLDQSLLICTLKDPRTSQGFIDRFLVASEAYHVPAVLVFNKQDTWRAKEQDHFELWRHMYGAAGYSVVAISVQTGYGIAEARELLRQKTTLLSGHSGVGKSSFLNAMFPKMDLRTGAVSAWSGKGMHTTTFAEMFDLDFGGRVIDTPGVREFGVVDVPPSELAQYFPEMRQLMTGCQFNNCLHLNEPNCAVKAAIADGQMHQQRYQSYQNILDTIPKNTW
ncbi:MAG: ribosome small subunit-dependent GTPase A [Bacteroidetes bacterium]|nr:MAG: ribosome small subunit-dependent GTPase A [Bacteroidota bacterium]